MRDILHDNELSISTGLVRALVDDQFPHYANLSITPLGASGSTNRLFRLGDELLVRLPRQPQSGKGISKERRWLPRIRAQLPVEVPEIVELGQPGAGYPERWSITRWLEGELPPVWQPGEHADQARMVLAEQLADFIRALQSIEITAEANDDDALRAYRGSPLAEYDTHFQRTLEYCRSIGGLDLDLEAAQAVWSEALELAGARVPGEARWYHSDLVAENLLIRNGRLAAVLDFGGLAIGDPTIELHGAWELFDPPARDLFRQALDVDDEQWLRGRAWALAIALGALSYYWQTMPGRCRDRLAMARAVLADAELQ
jgi:aminoglycoside phosphotransferase (APT) family kinase protein